jgi:hypothetical protein
MQSDRPGIPSRVLTVRERFRKSYQPALQKFKLGVLLKMTTANHQRFTVPANGWTLHILDRRRDFRKECKLACLMG